MTTKNLTIYLFEEYMNKFILSLFVLTMFSTSAFAFEEILAISIERTIPSCEIMNAINDLEEFDNLNGSDTFKANFYKYSSNTNPTQEAPYYGIVHISISYLKEEEKNKYLAFILEDIRFTFLWSTQFGPNPNPSVSGNN